MLWLLIILLLTTAIAVDDLRHRSVRLFLFPLLATSLVCSQKAVFSLIALNLFYNALYVLLLLGSCVLYLFVRYRRKDLHSYLGIGDILLMLCVALWFEPASFIFFNTASLIAALLLHLLLGRFFKGYNKFESVPLAGFQSLCFAVVILTQPDLNPWI
jgi:hypothetical protein